MGAHGLVGLMECSRGWEDYDFLEWSRNFFTAGIISLHICIKQYAKRIPRYPWKASIKSGTRLGMKNCRISIKAGSTSSSATRLRRLSGKTIREKININDKWDAASDLKPTVSNPLLWPKIGRLYLRYKFIERRSYPGRRHSPDWAKSSWELRRA